jgi:hypothetical protein
MTKQLVIVLFCLVTFGSCQSPAESESKEPNTSSHGAAVDKPFTDLVSSAHQSKEFRKNHAIQFDLLLSFGGSVRFDGTLTLKTSSGQGRMESKDGRTQYFDGSKAFEIRPDSLKAGSRFGIYTWPYFMLYPYKMEDKGSQWANYPNKELEGKTYLVEKQTFAAGTGDAPDDWYIAYADTETHLMRCSAYIITAGNTVLEAEEDPHAIRYDHYTSLSGVPIADEWSFWSWKTDKGLTEQLGEASLSNIRFLSPEQEAFNIPSDAVELK